MIFLVDNMYVCGLVDLDLFGKKYLIIIMKTVDNDRQMIMINFITKKAIMKIFSLQNIRLCYANAAICCSQCVEIDSFYNLNNSVRR